MSRAYDHWIYLQLEPTAPKLHASRSHVTPKRDRVPPGMSDEEIAERIAWDNDQQRRRAAAEAEEGGRV